ncbi:MAG TPA: HEAT repeat domain-containing protein [Gemmataceae bacterium]|nr:HEAT repeat domain-containing protein [Gemmataceae bacterium]
MSHPRRVAALLAATLLAVALPAGAETAFLGKKSGAWLRELADPKPEVRRGAAFALGKCGAAGAVPLLVRALDDADPRVRDAAAYAVGEIAAERNDPALWRKAGAALRKMLAEEKDPKAQRSAACAIGQFGPDAAEAREGLEKTLDHKDAAVRQNAAWALGRLKEKAGASGVNRLSAALRDADPVVRRDAAAALAEVGRPTAAPALRPLIECLAHEKEAVVRLVAVGSLVALAGPEDKEVAGDLRGLLAEKDREVKRGAALALAKIGGTEAKAALPVLLDALGDDDATARELAAAALAQLGEAAAEAVPALGKALSDRSPEVRRNAALALTRVGPRAGEVVRPLVHALDVREPAKVRQFAAEALGHTRGDAAELVVPELLPFIKNDRDSEVRQRLVCTVAFTRGFEGSEGAKVLEKVLHETDRDNRLVRYNTALVLAFVLQDRAPGKAVDVLVEMLDDTMLLEYRGTDATLKKGDESVKGGTGAKENLGGDARYMAAQALADIARSGKRQDARDALRTAAESKDEVKKKVAKDALKAIGLP